MPQKKPHILLLLDDEHRPDVMPIEGNPHIRTPTPDRFIEQGHILSQRLYPFPDLCAGASKLPLRSISAEHGMHRFRDGYAERGLDHPRAPITLWIPNSRCREDALRWS